MILMMKTDLLSVSECVSVTFFDVILFIIITIIIIIIIIILLLLSFYDLYLYN